MTSQLEKLGLKDIFSQSGIENRTVSHFNNGAILEMFDLGKKLSIDNTTIVETIGKLVNEGNININAPH